MEYKECVICGSRADHTHHLICGTSNRRISDEDRLTVGLCGICHDKLHRDAEMVRRSKQIGQAIYEMQQIAMYGCPAEDARNRFIKRYGKSFL